MRWRLVSLLLLAGGAAQAAVVSPRPQAVTVTIYHEGTVDTAELAQRNPSDVRGEGLAMINETRALDFPAGDQQIEFRGVAGTMVPQTAYVSGLPDGVAESNFDYDLMSPGALLMHSVGETVHLVRTSRHGGTVSEDAAVLKSGPDGAIVDVGGRVEALHCSGLPERLVFDRVPDGLRDSPTLTVRAHVAQAGHYRVTLRYIATGLNWSADYVARVAPDDRTLDLSGWITLANFGETGFADAPVEVIAGHVQTTGDDTPPVIRPVAHDDACWPTHVNWASFPPMMLMRAMGGLPPPPPPPPPPAPAMVESVVVTGTQIQARNLGDYKLYPLPEPTTVAARQTKQVQFLNQAHVPFERIYGHRVEFGHADFDSEKSLSSSVILRLKNTPDQGLGKPLPAGGVTVMAEGNGGALLLTGRDQIKDVSVGLPLEINQGETAQIWSQARVVTDEKIGKHRRETIEVTIGNARDKPVTFEWRQAMDVDGIRVTSESSKHGERDGDALWRLTLQPGATTVLRYALETPL